MARMGIDRRVIADAAYELAAREGLSRLGMRRIAETCGVSVGTIYNHFPTKDELIIDVISSFWRNAFVGDVCRVVPGERFDDYVVRVYAALREALAAFRTDWLPQIGALSMAGRDAGKMRESETFAHMRAGLLAVLEADAEAEPGRLEGIDAERLCAYVLDSMIWGLTNGEEDCRALIALLRAALYREGSYQA